MIVASGGGGKGTAGTANIEYDSVKTMEGFSSVQEQVDKFADSTNNIASKFNRIFSELSGKSIDSYQEVANFYIDSAKLAEEYIRILVDIVQQADQEIADAEKKSRNMFDDMG
ncbi:hypothetical protein GCM10011409_42970 [Lentibacillus populi]|uniref:ESAT-6-like protein n=1 Tax=Lentibacillus populi TaxID=1827502 RepID=A0A9W5U236_9BACI|nr:hypothetical protein [Lentibacillus populi]GGB61102.1 hypothetical protein GCM10011409_42970 [Lentibacillus populi]